MNRRPTASIVKYDIGTAFLESKVEVPPLFVPINLPILAGARSGQTFRLKGKGMPALKWRRDTSHFLVTMNIKISTELNANPHLHNAPLTGSRNQEIDALPN